MPVEDVSTRYHLRDSSISVHGRKSLFANTAEESWLMKKFLKNNALNASININRKNCPRLSGSSFFYDILRQKFIYLLLLAIPLNTGAQQTTGFNHLAFQNIISLRFDEASSNLRKSKDIDPDNPYTIFLENYLQFMRCAIDCDHAAYRNYKTAFDKRVKILNSHSEDAALRFQAEMNLHSFLLAINHQDNFQALKKLMLARNQLNYFLQHAKVPDAGRRLQGMLLIILSAIPDELMWISSLAGIRGDYDKGISMLEECMRQYEPHTAEYIEMILIITCIRNIFKQDYQANFNRLGRLPGEYLKNPLYRLVYTISAAKSGHNDEVIKTINKYQQDPEEHKICYFNYLYGCALLNRMDSNAEISLHQYIECSSSDLFLKSAYRKLAWNYLIHGDTSSFEKYRKMVLDSGSLNADVDRQAHYELAFPGIPNTDLVRARLLFDGGYYDLSKSLLLKKETRKGLQNIYQQTEYSYRLARIYHQHNETDKAVRLYQLTLEKGIGHPFYYAAHAALQLGIIYERLGDTRKAKSYYLKVIETSDKSYGNRFRHSAREGIRRLDEKVNPRN